MVLVVVVAGAKTKQDKRKAAMSQMMVIYGLQIKYLGINIAAWSPVRRHSA